MNELLSTILVALLLIAGFNSVKTIDKFQKEGYTYIDLDIFKGTVCAFKDNNRICNDIFRIRINSEEKLSK